MAENEEEFVEEAIPAHITEDYLQGFLAKTAEFIRTLGEEGKYDIAGNVSRIVTVLENVNAQFKEEEQRSKALLAQHVDASKRIEEATAISQRDHDVIQQLKKEVLDAWSNADASVSKEQHVYESLEIIKERNMELSQRLEKYTMRNYDDTDELGEEKSTIIKEINRMYMENEELHKRLFVQRAYSEELQKQLENSIEKNRELYREWDSATNDTLANKRRIEILSKKLESLTDEQDKLVDNLEHYKEAAENRYKRLKEREKKIEELSEELNGVKCGSAAMNVAKNQLETALKSYKSELVHNRYEMKQSQNYVRLKDDENRKLVSELDQEIKKVQHMARKVADTERNVGKLEQELLLAKNHVVTAERERDLLKKACDVLTKENDKLSSKIEIQIKEFERLNGIILSAKQENESITRETKQLKTDLKIAVEQAKVLSTRAKQLQANFDTVETEKLHLNGLIQQQSDDIKQKVKQLEECEIQIQAAKVQAEKFKDGYITAVQDIKKAESKFQRCHEKEATVKYRMKMYTNQIRSTDHRLAAKINEVMTLMKAVAKFERTIFEMQSEHSKTKESLRQSREEVKNHEIEKSNLTNDLQSLEEKFSKFRTQVETTLHERNLIAKQMYRHANEKVIKDTEVMTLKMTIERGNTMYNESLEEIRILKCEIKNLRMQCNALKRGLGNTADMRHEVFQLHRKLNQERVKAKVLSEEMATPMNVHRWRKLNYIDPTRVELINKCQKLQRKSIKQFNQITKAEEIIKSLNEKIVELQKKEVEMRPSAVLHEKLLFTRVRMEKNEKRMKAAIAISRASESDVSLKDHTISQLQRDLNESKSQLLREKRERQKMKEKMHQLSKELKTINE